MTKPIRFALLGALTMFAMPSAPTISGATEMSVPAPKRHHLAPHGCGDAEDCAKGQDCVMQPGHKLGVCVTQRK